MTNAIGWCDETWNPMVGCSPVSEACENCYAERMAWRFNRYFGPGHGQERAVRTDYFRPTFHPERLDKPLHWRKPRRVFVCSMSDLFHEAFTYNMIRGVFGAMILASQHTYVVLTKRPERMRAWFKWAATQADANTPGWPLRNLWLGVTVENQARADERIPILLETPAAVRFVCCEPLLGPVELGSTWWDTTAPGGRPPWTARSVHWVIVGGENGPGARPMQPELALDVYRQCKAAGVPFWWKGGSKGADYETEMTATRELPWAPPSPPATW
jgi:protein gp37